MMQLDTLHNQFEELSGQITACEKCPRLVTYRQDVARVKRRAFREMDYWGRPVPGFGDENARVLIVGLAPGAHGSNRTGRMFTGDDSGRFLYRALYREGFANQPTAIDRSDSLVLKDIFITAVGRCAPPDNKPTRDELAKCQPFLSRELDLLQNLRGVVALGRIAYDVMQRLLVERGNNIPQMQFSHNAFSIDENTGFWLLGSYHPSRQNTQTGRLTEAMFDAIWLKVKQQLTEETSGLR
jgi:uracil-DNA glycosylase family 4